MKEMLLINLSNAKNGDLRKTIERITINDLVTLLPSVWVLVCFVVRWGFDCCCLALLRVRTYKMRKKGDMKLYVPNPYHRG